MLAVLRGTNEAPPLTSSPMIVGLHHVSSDRSKHAKVLVCLHSGESTFGEHRVSIVWDEIIVDERRIHVQWRV